MESCIFCEIANTDPKKQIIRRFTKKELNGFCDVVMFKPLNPRVEGHLLFVPDMHINNIGDISFISPDVIATTYKAINMYLFENPTQCNVWTNHGATAEQTVFHLHVHLVPRIEGDDINLLWKDNK